LKGVVNEGVSSLIEVLASRKGKELQGVPIDARQKPDWFQPGRQRLNMNSACKIGGLTYSDRYSPHPELLVEKKPREVLKIQENEDILIFW